MANIRITVNTDRRALAAIRRGVNGIIGDKVRDAGEELVRVAQELANERLETNRPSQRRRHPDELHYVDSFHLGPPEVRDDEVSIRVSNFHPAAWLIETGNPPHYITPRGKNFGGADHMVFPWATTSEGGNHYAETGGKQIFTQTVNWRPLPGNEDGYHILSDAHRIVSRELGTIRVIVRPRVRS